MTEIPKDPAQTDSRYDLEGLLVERFGELASKQGDSTATRTPSGFEISSSSQSEPLNLQQQYDQLLQAEVLAKKAVDEARPGQDKREATLRYESVQASVRDFLADHEPWIQQDRDT